MIRALVSWRGPLHVTFRSSLHDTIDCIVERTLTRHILGALSTIQSIVSWRGPLHVTFRSSLHDTSACIVERGLTRHLLRLSPRYERLYRGERPYTSQVVAFYMIQSLVSLGGPVLDENLTTRQKHCPVCDYNSFDCNMVLVAYKEGLIHSFTVSS